MQGELRSIVDLRVIPYLLGCRAAEWTRRSVPQCDPAGPATALHDPAIHAAVCDDRGRLRRIRLVCQPGAYLQLATVLHNADDDAAIVIAREITTRWDKEARPERLEAPAVPTRIRCRHLLAQGAARLPSTK
jgi:hypothetical protein